MRLAKQYYAVTSDGFITRAIPIFKGNYDGQDEVYYAEVEDRLADGEDACWFAKQHNTSVETFERYFCFEKETDARAVAEEIWEAKRVLGTVTSRKNVMQDWQTENLHEQPYNVSEPFPF